MTGMIYLGATEYSVNEREGFVTITIKRDGDTSGAVSVSYGSNPDGATPALDYTAVGGNAIIAAGSTSTTVRIPILNDTLGEPTEKFNVSLINVDSGTLLFPRTTLVSILDDENPIAEPPNPPQTSPYTIARADAVTGLDGPMQIEWIQDSNYALVSEKEGRIKVVNFDTGTVVSTLLDITGKVNADADRGLLDIALHPDLENNPYLYAYYVADPADVKASGPASADNLGNRYAHLVRYELDMSGTVPTIKPGSETVMLGGAGKSLNDISGGGALDFTDPIHSDKRASDVNADGTYKQDYIKVDSRSHAGGAIAFGPDGALYVSTGDGTSYNYADPRTASVQNVNSLSGKILRIDPITGDGYADNPYATSDLDANASKVWQMGLRNPYAMTFTDDGRIMISETGWYSWEEINSGGKGANYGWPYYEGADNGEINKTPGYQTMPGASLFYTNVANGTITITPAFRAFSHTASDPGYQMAAIVGGTSVYDGDKYPEIFKGDYFFSDIVDGDIFTVDVNDRTQMQYVTNIGTYHAVSFVQGPDGYIYYSDITGNKIVRLEITDPNGVPNRAPVVANAIADTAGTVGNALSITIPSNAFSDPDGDRLDLTARLSNGGALPSWLSFNAATRTFAGTPPGGQTGPIDIRVTAADPDGATVNDVFRLTIGGTVDNRAPVVAAPAADQSATSGVNWSYKLPAGTFTDADNDALTLLATQANGQDLPGWVSFNAQTGSFSGTPPAGVNGTFTFRVTATDPKGAAATDDFVLTVNAAGETIVNDVTSQNQFVTGTSANDVFRYAGPSSLYQWGPNSDGTGIVVWTRSSTDNTFDVLTGFEKLRFSDKTVDLKGNGGPDYADAADTIQNLTGTTTADRFIINGPSTAYAWGNTQDGKGIVIWTLSSTDDTYDILNGFDQLVFTDKTVYLSGTPPANTAPVVANPVVDQTTAEEASFSFVLPANTFTDANGDSLTLSATTAAGAALPGWLKFDAATRTFSGRPDDANVGTISVKVTASDGKGGTVSDTFDIKVTPVNDAPVVKASIANQTTAHTWEFSYAVPAGTFTDADGDTLTLSAKLANGAALPAWLKFDAATGLFSGVPQFADIGTLAVMVTAADGSGGTVTDTFDIVVNKFDRGPRVMTPILDQTGTAGSAYSYTVPASTFVDDEQDQLVYSAKLASGDALPTWLQFDAATRTFSGNPPSTQAGSFEIQVTARDPGGLTAFDIFEITIAPAANSNPVLANPLADRVIIDNETFTLTLPANSFSDPDGDSLRYEVTLANGSSLPAWMTYDPLTGTVYGMATRAEPDLAIRVTALDGRGGSVSDTYNLKINYINNAPERLRFLEDVAISQASALDYKLQPFTFKDPDVKDVLSYSAQLADGSALPTWLKIDANTGQMTTTAGAAPVGTFNIILTATDPMGLSASDEFKLTITAGNVAPVVANPIADAVAAEEGNFTFVLPSNTFNDANGDMLTLTATTASGTPLPAWLTFNAATRTFSGKPDDADIGTLSIAVTASDSKGGLVTDTFDLTVTAVNDAPQVSKPIIDQTGASGSTFSFALPSGTFTDVDSPTLTYAATLSDGKALPSWLSFNTTTGLFTGNPGDAQVGSLNIKVTARDQSGLSASDEFKLTIGGKQAGETLYQNTSANQNIDAGDGKDVFVMGASSNGYSWGPTQDGKGVVVWNSKGFDILFNFEELRFTNTSVTVASIVGNGSSEVLDEAASTQYLVGKSNADRFIIDGVAADYGWGKTQDGKGIVVWDRSGDNPHDILTGFEKLVFDDREVDVSGLV